MQREGEWDTQKSRRVCHNCGNFARNRSFPSKLILITWSTSARVGGRRSWQCLVFCRTWRLLQVRCLWFALKLLMTKYFPLMHLYRSHEAALLTIHLLRNCDRSRLAEAKNGSLLHKTLIIRPIYIIFVKCRLSQKR